MHKNEKGFTLVELMVVVVIIGILVAIAIPLYSGIQESARERAHEANMRTLHGAGAMHVSEGLGDAVWTEAADTVFISSWPDNPWPEGHAVHGEDEYRVDITGQVIAVSFGEIEEESGGETTDP